MSLNIVLSKQTAVPYAFILFPETIWYPMDSKSESSSLGEYSWQSKIEGAREEIYSKSFLFLLTLLRFFFCTYGKNLLVASCCARRLNVPTVNGVDESLFCSFGVSSKELFG